MTNGGGDGDIDNTAIASSDQAADVQDSAEAPLAAQTPSLTVTKTSPQTLLGVLTTPGTVTYEYLVSNTGNVTITGLSLSDDNDDDNMSCDSTSILTVAPDVGSSTTCSATHSFIQAELDAGKSGNQAAGTCNNGLYNVVTASSKEAADALDTLCIPIIQNALMSIDKTVSNISSGAGGVFVVGDTVEYGYPGEQHRQPDTHRCEGERCTLAGLIDVVCSSLTGTGCIHVHSQQRQLPGDPGGYRQQRWW